MKIFERHLTGSLGVLKSPQLLHSGQTHMPHWGARCWFSFTTPWNSRSLALPISSASLSRDK